jgi:ribosome-binding factor A
MLASTIQRELAAMILRDLQDPRITGLPSITRVRVSPDLSEADVYMTIMGTPGQQSAALNALRHSAGMMRSKLTKALTLRVAPYLKFHMDENLKKELAVLDLLRKVSEENAELDRRRAAEAEAVRGDGETGDEPQGQAGEDQQQGQAESNVAAAASQASEDNPSQ